MPKIKTHKGAAKRISVTKNGKLMRKKAFGNHFLTKKSASRKRTYAKTYQVSGSDKKNLLRMLSK
jgi:large subunit ribosomal protein L35